MPSTTSSSVSRLLASSTVMTPSLPTFFIASAIILPIEASPLAEIVPTWAISSIVVTLAAVFLRSATIGLDREVDAALEVHRIGAGGDRFGAFLDDGVGENGRRRGAVAGEVALLRGDFAHHLGAHVLELVGKLDLLGDGDAVLGDARRAEALLDHHVAALRAERHADRVGENVDAANHPLARVLRKLDFLGRHAFLLRKT